MRTFATLLITLVLAGCTATHKVERTHSESVLLDPNGTAYVSMPENGRYDQIVYENSGRQTVFAVRGAFSPHLRLTKTASDTADRSSALKEAGASGYTYLIEPEILHWEDRATEWSGLLDKIKVKVTIIDVATGNVLDSAQLEAQGKWATLGGDHPEQLLEQPLTDYARSLFP